MDKEYVRGEREMAFVHLQVISSYSLLQSTTQLEDLVRTAKSRGYTALALTDHNNLHGQIDFYKLCRKAGIKPILGLQLDLPGIVRAEQSHPMVLLAKNYAGYQKLCELSTLRLSEGQEGALRQALKQGMENLIAITPGERGEVEHFLSRQEYERADEVLSYWRNILPDGDFYLGIQPHTHLQHLVTPLQQLSAKRGLPLVGLHDVRYLQPEDHFSCRVLQAIQAGEQLDPHREEMSGSHYLPLATDVERTFREAGLEKCASETERVAARINIELPLNQPLLPRYPVPDGKSAEAFLRELCEIGLRDRVPDADQGYRERLAYELSVIHEMGFDDYFLIVWDVMDYAARAKILPGAGRGSAAGSLVAYVLRITHVDPIEYNLLFERFLSRERYTLPDIDLDFPDDRRDEVLRYVQQKYGERHVAQIITFGTLAAKMSLRDTARVFGLTPAEAGKWSNAVPSQLGITLEAAYRNSAEMRRLADSSPQNRLLFDTARKIEGVPRHTSTHAAGIVISDRPLMELIPLQRKGGDLHVTQYPMGNVEEIGLLKMDFLGLKNLTILNDAVQMAQRETKETIDPFSFPVNDQETMALFRRADTDGIFQFESSGLKNVLRKLGPETLEDLAAVNALYRPGPMEQIDTFIARKKGEVPVSYPHPDLAPILEVTYGVMVYQEQVMQVASKMAGFTLGEADILRRAIGKKQKETLDRERRHFVEGALHEGYSQATAEEVYDYIERFANYGFNRSHSVAYSFIAYQMAYMKAHHPAAFFAALLNSINQHSDKMKEYLLDIKRHHVELVHPDINASGWRFAMVEGRIQYGLSGIKGLRRDFIQEIITQRRENGMYRDFLDFLRRMPAKWQKADWIVPLIVSGAFDRFGHNRATLLQSLPGMLSSLEYSGNNVDLFQVLEPKYVKVDELPLGERIELEEEHLGHSLLGHPVDQYADLYQDGKVKYIAELIRGKKALVMGLVKEVKRIQTKKGDPMAFLVLSDATGTLDVTVFPEPYLRYLKELKKDELVLISGKLETSRRNEQPSFLLEGVFPLQQFMEKHLAERKEKKRTCFLRLQRTGEKEHLFRKMEEILRRFPGEIPVIVYDPSTKEKILLDHKYWLDPSSGAMESLAELLGKENVVIQ